MFLKPFKIKSNTKIKSSERKKLLSTAEALFKISNENISILSKKSNDVYKIKAMTHCDQILYIYLFAEMPMFFELHDQLYPTIFAQWTLSNCQFLPTFTTYAEVLTKLQGGSALMLPGVIVAKPLHPKSFGNLRKGVPCFVNLDNTRAAVALGCTQLDSEDMYMSGGRGKALGIMHFYGDELCKMVNYPKLPIIAWNEPAISVFSLPQIDNATVMSSSNTTSANHVNIIMSSVVTPASYASATTSHLNSDVCSGNDEKCIEISHNDQYPLQHHNDAIDNDNIDITHDKEELSLSAICLQSEDCEADCDDDGVGDNIDLVQCDDDNCHDNENNTADDDDEEFNAEDLIMECFLHALKFSVTDVLLPMPTNVFYGKHVISFCPTTNRLDIKKTSYKKVNVLMNEMMKKGLITVENSKSGVQTLLKINRDHEMLSRTRRILQQHTGDNLESNKDDAISTPDYVPPVIEDIWCIVEKVHPLFSPYGYKKGDALSATQVRTVITEYINSNHLQTQNDGKLVTLDAVLSTAVSNTKTGLQDNLSWQDLMQCVMSQMNRGYRMTFGDDAVILRKKHLTPINLKTEMRGNKQVTLVSGLSEFRIPLAQLSRTVQRSQACSCTITENKAGTEQILQAQGDQIRFFSKCLLEKYGIPRKYIIGFDDSKPKGKHKKKG